MLVAIEEARGLGHGELRPEHLLLGALRSDGASDLALAGLGLREGAIRARIGRKLPRGSADTGADVSLGTQAVWVLAAGVRYADDARQPQVGSNHVLLALSDMSGVAEVLAACGIPAEAVRTAVRHQPADSDGRFAAAVAGIEAGDPAAAARTLMALILRRGPVAAWLAERGVDESAVRRAFPALELRDEAPALGAAADAG